MKDMVYYKSTGGKSSKMMKEYDTDIRNRRLSCHNSRENNDSVVVGGGSILDDNNKNEEEKDDDVVDEEKDEEEKEDSYSSDYDSSDSDDSKNSSRSSSNSDCGSSSIGSSSGMSSSSSSCHDRDDATITSTLILRRRATLPSPPPPEPSQPGTELSFVSLYSSMTPKATTAKRTSFVAAATAVAATSSFPSLNLVRTPSHNNDNRRDDVEEEEELDPIIEPCRRSPNRNILTSSIFASATMAVATVLLRRRRHPSGVEISSSSSQKQQQPTASCNKSVTRIQQHSHSHRTQQQEQQQQQEHHRLTNSSQRRHYRNAIYIWQKIQYCNTLWKDIFTTTATNNHRHQSFRIDRHPDRNLTNSHNCKIKNSNNNIRTKHKRKRRRKFHPSIINTMATYLLGTCIATWLVVFLWNLLNHVYSDDTTTSMTRATMFQNENYNDYIFAQQQLQQQRQSSQLQHRDNLPLRERTRLRRSRSIHPNHHKSSSNSLVHFGLYINTLLLSPFRWIFNVPESSTVPAMHMNPNINNINRKVDSEELPKECHRAEWQSYNYPTCNDIYEIDLPNMIRMAPRKYYHDTGRLYHGTNTNSNNISNNDTIVKTNSHMGYVAQGFWRSVWAVYPPRRDITPSNHQKHQSTTKKTMEPNVVVLKTMRRSHDLSTRNYERHRRDAIVMEQLTSSPYVMDIYGFCGNSVLTEYMDLTLEDIAFDDSQYPIIDTDNGDEITVTSTKRIQMALDMIRGVQAIHEISGGPIVHADLQAKQFLISRSTGTVKINDFNRCRFMASKSINCTESDQDVITNAIINDSGTNASKTTSTATVPCKFRIPSAPGTSRSPEEYMENELDEKIDVYAVGHVLYNLLSYREAWDGYHTITAQQRMMNGEIPNMDRFIQSDDTHNHTGSPAAIISHALSDLPIHIQQWYINITKQAYTFDPDERISASALALELEAMLKEIQGHL